MLSQLYYVDSGSQFRNHITYLYPKQLHAMDQKRIYKRHWHVYSYLKTWHTHTLYGKIHMLPHYTRNPPAFPRFCKWMAFQERIHTTVAEKNYEDFCKSNEKANACSRIINLHNFFVCYLCAQVFMLRWYRKKWLISICIVLIELKFTSPVQ